MLVDGKAAVLRHFDLAPFDLGVEKLLDASALQANEMVVVTAFVQLEDRLAAFEMMTNEQARLRELREHAVYRSQAHVHIFREQQSVHVFRGQVPHLARFEEIQNFEPRQRDFEPAAF